MKTKKNKTAVYFVVLSVICLFIFIVSLVILQNLIKIRAEKARQLNEYNLQLKEYREKSQTGDPLITPSPKLK